MPGISKMKLKGEYFIALTKLGKKEKKSLYNPNNWLRNPIKVLPMIIKKNPKKKKNVPTDFFLFKKNFMIFFVPIIKYKPVKNKKFEIHKKNLSNHIITPRIPKMDPSKNKKRPNVLFWYSIFC